MNRRPRGRPKRRPIAAFEPYLFLTPGLLLLVLVMFVPVLVGLSYAFRSVQLFDLGGSGWVGLQHFRDLVADADFWGALLNTLWWTGGSLALQFLLGFGLALLLDRPFRGRRLVPGAGLRALGGADLPLRPHLVVAAQPGDRAAAALDGRARPDGQPENILADPATAMWGPIAANVWFGVPFFAITLLAALQAIPAEFYEAAAIDGATLWQRFRHITLPFLAPAIAITVMLRTIWIANFADLIWVMTGGGPANATQTLATYIFSTAYSRLDFGYASAIAAVLLVLLLLYAVALLRIRRGLLRGG
jgi:multiple sugar transport system permease protein